MNESLVKYLAGLLDADGSLSFNFKNDHNRPDRNFVGVGLRLASSDAVDLGGFIETLPELTGMGGVSRYGANQQFKTWTVSRRSDLERLLPRLLKHMLIKAQHWQWILDSWRGLRSATVSGEEMEALKIASKESRQQRVGPLKPKNHPTWAWLAGYLDGDGCYAYRKHFARTIGRWQWSMNVSALTHVNDASVLAFIQNAFGGSIRDEGPTMKKWTRSLGYQSRSFAESFLGSVAKHSRLKRHKIEAILHHHQQRLSVPGTERRYCEVDGCERRRHGNGLCQMHYQRKRREV